MSKELEERIKETKIKEQQERCEDWGLYHSYCKSYNSEYCPKSCSYALKMEKKNLEGENE